MQQIKYFAVTHDWPKISSRASKSTTNILTQAILTDQVTIATECEAAQVHAQRQHKEVALAQRFTHCRFEFSWMDALASHLGVLNPFVSPANAEDNIVWLFDTVAWQDNLNRPTTKCRAAFFRRPNLQRDASILTDFREALACLIGISSDAIIAERIQPFLYSIQPSCQTSAFWGMQKIKVGPSLRDGLSTNVATLDPSPYSDNPQHLFLEYKPPADEFGQEARVECYGSTGWGVISDIDDTIKLTQGGSILSVLVNTFVQPLEPIEGMSVMYGQLKSLLENPPFWYISGSPYNLYPFLRKFRDDHNFPYGPLILRDVSWQNVNSLLRNLVRGTRAFKIARVREVYEKFPNKKIICIGDSIQEDPEAYAEMYRLFPNWIRMIFIRRAYVCDETLTRNLLTSGNEISNEISSVTEDDESEGENLRGRYTFIPNNCEERFERAFKDVPRELWHVFSDPNEVLECVKLYIAKHNNG